MKRKTSRLCVSMPKQSHVSFICTRINTSEYISHCLCSLTSSQLSHRYSQTDIHRYSHIFTLDLTKETVQTYPLCSESRGPLQPQPLQQGHWNTQHPPKKSLERQKRTHSHTACQIRLVTVPHQGNSSVADLCDATQTFTEETAVIEKRQLSRLQ